MVLKLFPPLAKAGKAVLPKTFSGSVSSFFSGTSGKVASTGLKVGTGVGGAGILASIGLGSFGDSFKNFTEGTGLDPTLLVVIIGGIVILFLIVVLKK